MIPLADKRKAKLFKRFYDLCLWGVHGEFWHQTATPASAINASNTGVSSFNTSLPNVAM